jgi:hypothetical protein
MRPMMAADATGIHPDGRGFSPLSYRSDNLRAGRIQTPRIMIE